MIKHGAAAAHSKPQPSAGKQADDILFPASRRPLIGASEDGLLWSSKPESVREEAIRRKERQDLCREVSL